MRDLIDKISYEECRVEFRFWKNDVYLLHEALMLADSGLLNLLQAHSYNPAGNPLCIYGDPAFPHRVHLQRPYGTQNLTPSRLGIKK